MPSYIKVPKTQFIEIATTHHHTLTYNGVIKAANGKRVKNWHCDVVSLSLEYNSNMACTCGCSNSCREVTSTHGLGSAWSLETKTKGFNFRNSNDQATQNIDTELFPRV